jgi:8-oxo-dGTP pyrophosphatase MutT (NUDIX family)
MGGRAKTGSAGNLPRMSRRTPRRDHSAGGVVLDRRDGVVSVALIRPTGRMEGSWSLPKGHLDPGEDALAAALREVREETGLTCSAVRSLRSLSYVFVAGGERVTKIVDLWLMRVEDGEIDVIDEAMRAEVAEARWLPLDEAIDAMTYRGEAGALEEVVALRAAQGAPISNS